MRKDREGWCVGYLPPRTAHTSVVSLARAAGVISEFSNNFSCMARRSRFEAESSTISTRSCAMTERICAKYSSSVFQQPSDSL